MNIFDEAISRGCRVLEMLTAIMVIVIFFSLFFFFVVVCGFIGFLACPFRRWI